MIQHPHGPQLAVGSWLVDAKRAAVALPIDVEEGWVSPEYARRTPAPVLVVNVQGEGDLTFVTVLVPVEGEAAVDLERLAHLDMEQDVQCAA